MTGENFFVSKFIYRGQQKGHVALGTSFPSKIVRLKLSDFVGGEIICQKGAFLCGSDTVNIEMVNLTCTISIICALCNVPSTEEALMSTGLLVVCFCRSLPRKSEWASSAVKALSSSA